MPVTKIRKETFRHIEKEIRDYEWTKKQIAKRREELLNPYNEYPDENIGGGRNPEPGRPTERIATRMMLDNRLRNMEEIIEAIEYAWKMIGEDHRKVIKAKYWNNRHLNWDGVADEVNMHKNTAMRLRKDFILLVADKIGWR